MTALLLSSLALAAAIAATGFALLLLRRRSGLERQIQQQLLEIDLLRDQSLQQEHRLLARVETLNRSHDQLSLELQQLTERFQRVEMHAGLCVPPRPVQSGLNINKRVEVVRMFHEGYAEEAISEELAVPLGEVRLLIHLERSSLESTSKPTRKKQGPGSNAA